MVALGMVFLRFEGAGTLAMYPCEHGLVSTCTWLCIHMVMYPLVHGRVFAWACIHILMVVYLHAGFGNAQWATAQNLVLLYGLKRRICFVMGHSTERIHSKACLIL
jgi:hypothetical protein